MVAAAPSAFRLAYPSFGVPHCAANGFSHVQVQCTEHLQTNGVAPRSATPLRLEIIASVQSVQIDNQLASACYPVMLSRRDALFQSDVSRLPAGAGLLKAAERQREQQALGPPQVRLRIERELALAGAPPAPDDGIIIKYAS